MLDQMNDFFQELTPQVVGIKLLLSTVMGGFIGMERARKRYSAGIRTFALVCLGSALATIVGIHLGYLSNGTADIGRIPAQILSGIGFLGVGTIIFTDRKQIKGLTTAAGLWVTGIIGMAIGAGFVIAAVICFVLVLFTTYYMFYMARYMGNHMRTIEVYVELERSAVIPFIKYIKDCGYVILSLERQKGETILEPDIALKIEMDMLERIDHAEVLDKLLGIEEVHYIEEVL
jgi:putative Mg2+ transporter-C (MgtC) family protein